MFISVRFWSDFDEEVKKLEFGEKEMGNLRRGTAGMVAEILNVIRKQIRTVLVREGACHADVAFFIGLEKAKLHVEIFAFPINETVPMEEDQIAVLFPLLERRIVIPLKKVVVIDAPETFNYVSEAILQLTADFAREGIPQDMKKKIAELGRFLRNAIGPHAFPSWWTIRT